MDAEKESNVTAAVSTSDNETRGSQHEAGAELPPFQFEEPGVSEEDSRRWLQIQYKLIAIQQEIENSVMLGPKYRFARVGFMLFLMGIIFLIVFGIVLVHPTLNDMKMKSAECRVVSSEISNGGKSCSCGRSCKSSYPCLEIQVSFNADGEQHTAYLYEKVSNDKNKCSTQPCFVGAENYYRVSDFRDNYGQAGDTYTCFYYPKKLDEVFKTINSLKKNEMTIMHSTLWPSLMSAIGIGLLIVFVCRFKGYCCFKKRDGSCSVPTPTTNSLLPCQDSSAEHVVTNCSLQQYRSRTISIYLDTLKKLQQC